MFALILGIPTLKLRGDYLAIVTIAAAEIIRYVGRSTALDGPHRCGRGGLRGRPVQGHRSRTTCSTRCARRRRTWAHRPRSSTLVATGSTQLVDPDRRLGRSSVLRLLGSSGCSSAAPGAALLKGIREDEDAVRSLGKNVFAIKMQALVLGGVFGSLGGMIYVLPRAVQPDSMGRSMTFFIWTILLLGGAATCSARCWARCIFWAVLILIKRHRRALRPRLAS